MRHLPHDYTTAYLAIHTTTQCVEEELKASAKAAMSFYMEHTSRGIV